VNVRTLERLANRELPGSSRDLQMELGRAIEGEVRFDAGTRALYATDGSNYRHVPIGVIRPRSEEDVIAAVRVCADHDVPILGRGGGTSLAGQTCNEAVVFDFSRHMDRILELDPAKRVARVEPGVVLDSLRAEAEKHHLTFAPDPSTHRQCTFGGMIGNNSCGVHSLMAGKAEENVERLRVLTYGGQILDVGPTDDDELHRIARRQDEVSDLYRGLRELAGSLAEEIRGRYPRIPRRVSGYNLNQLLPENGFNVARALVGTESTCAMTLEATVRLVPSPPVRSVVVLGYEDVIAAAADVPEVLEHRPIGLEGIDDVLISDMKKKGLHPKDLRLLPEGEGWLVVEFGADSKEEADQQANDLIEAIKRRGASQGQKLYDKKEEEDLVWEIRESGLGATARVPGEPDTWEGWEDSAVAPERLAEYLRDLRKLYGKHALKGALYGHFGQGCVHTRIDFDLLTADGISRFRSFLEEASDLVVSLGGSLSGEHGDGQSRAEFLPKMFGEKLVRGFEGFKDIWDPRGRMNPGKIVRPHRVTDDLRLGTSYEPPAVNTHFRFLDDGGTFARATTRCVGVGNCRRLSGGIMCPSYQVTHEEQHSTRGRARMLFEMLQGDPLTTGWKSDEVKGALDLCLACKGCKSECPVNVDMATYKAEFLSHYYEHRIRPAAAYSMGLIDKWAMIGSFAPRFVNGITQDRFAGAVLKRMGGVASERSIPRFAPVSFRRWARGQPRLNPTGERVLLWPDTFNDAFHPAVAAAGFQALRSAGFEVVVPPRLCCGRPLYDFGMLAMAKSYLRKILKVLRDDIRAGTPVVGLEPSCLAVFRDELTGLFPDDVDAKRLHDQTFSLSDFLLDRGVEIPRTGGKVLVQEHCHHRSVLGTSGDRRVMDALGLEVEVLDSGCCGMAGSFGFERDKYEVSMAAGERVLLPRVREAEPGTTVIADGFSCREQIFQATGERALHIAQLIAPALASNQAITQEANL
jgi:FAD/FMN-containing dehydrogenase/Fe-S oxidoreductase